MSLKIRLARGGSKKRPVYSVVIADARAPRDGRFIEKIGAYNPLLGKDNESRFTVNQERAQHWLSKGAQPTDRVARYFGNIGLVKWSAGNNPNKGKLGKAATARIAEKQAKVEAAAAAAAAAAAVAVAPAEEAASE